MSLESLDRFITDLADSGIKLPENIQELALQVNYLGGNKVPDTTTFDDLTAWKKFHSSEVDWRGVVLQLSPSERAVVLSQIGNVNSARNLRHAAPLKDGTVGEFRSLPVDTLTSINGLGITRVGFLKIAFYRSASIEECRQAIIDYIGDAPLGSAKIWALCDSIDQNLSSVRHEDLLNKPNRSPLEERFLQDEQLLGVGIQLRQMEHIATVPGYQKAYDELCRFLVDLDDAFGNPHSEIAKLFPALRDLQKVRDNILAKFNP